MLGAPFAPGQVSSLFEWRPHSYHQLLFKTTPTRPAPVRPHTLDILYILSSTTIQLALLLPSPLALYAPEPPVAVGAAVREAKPTASYRSMAAGSSASSCDERAMCSLAPFARVLHLFSMVGVSVGSASGLAQLQHFFIHYRDSVGVPPAHMTFVLDAMEANSSAVVTLAGEWARWLRSQGVGNVSISLNQYAGSADAHKRISANALLERLPADAWLMMADSDEFFRFPCELVNGGVSGGQPTLRPVCGRLIDRLPSNLSAGAALPSVLPPSAGHASTMQQQVRVHATFAGAVGGLCVERRMPLPCSLLDFMRGPPLRVPLDSRVATTCSLSSLTPLLRPRVRSTRVYPPHSSRSAPRCAARCSLPTRASGCCCRRAPLPVAVLGLRSSATRTTSRAAVARCSVPSRGTSITTP